MKASQWVAMLLPCVVSADQVAFVISPQPVGTVRGSAATQALRSSMASGAQATHGGVGSLCFSAMIFTAGMGIGIAAAAGPVRRRAAKAKDEDVKTGMTEMQALLLGISPKKAASPPAEEAPKKAKEAPKPKKEAPPAPPAAKAGLRDGWADIAAQANKVAMKK
mmetsp:Transcript_11026/g.19998  ORF Transcript_11026/g.19998 Transcript_11026/m.19998 type:complete len:164 (-) Transcript_11026:73-564(-)